MPPRPTAIARSGVREGDRFETCLGATRLRLPALTPVGRDEHRAVLTNRHRAVAIREGDRRKRCLGATRDGLPTLAAVRGAQDDTVIAHCNAQSLVCEGHGVGGDGIPSGGRCAIRLPGRGSGLGLANGPGPGPRGGARAGARVGGSSRGPPRWGPGCHQAAVISARLFAASRTLSLAACAPLPSAFRRPGDSRLVETARSRRGSSHPAGRGPEVVAEISEQPLDLRGFGWRQ